MATRLHIEEQQMATLHSWMLCSPHIRTEEQLVSMGLTIYAVFNVTNRLRFQGRGNNWSDNDSFEALAQALKEVVRGCKRSSKILRSRWNQNTASENVKREHNKWWDPAVDRKRLMTRGPR